MVVIRLSRGGMNKRPFYKVVVADSRRPRDGRFIESLGYFNPVAVGKEIRLVIDKERFSYWISCGAQPSERVAKLFVELEKPEILEKRQVKKEKVKVAKANKAKADAAAAVVAEVAAE